MYYNYEAGFRLLDLPDAAALRVCQYLPDTSIYAASLSCRCLNQLALGIFLARHGIIEPTSECKVLLDGRDLAGRLNLLHALNLATFFRSTESLSLIFLNADLSLVSRDLVRCLGLVHRLSPLRNVYVQFRSTIYGSEAIRRDEKIKKQWNSSVADLWMALLMNGSVKSLNIQTQWAFVQRYKSYDKSNVTPTRKLGGIKTRLVRTLRNKLDTAIFTRRETPPGRFTITTLDIDSEILFLPPFYQLLVLTMRRSPITSLRLHNAVLSPRQWSHVFTDVVAAVPDLTELKITQADISPTPLCRFLSRLPRLARLTIQPYFAVFASDIYHPPAVRDIPQFPHLIMLSLHADYLTIFLRRSESLSRVRFLDLGIHIRDLMEPPVLPDLVAIHRYPFLDITLHVQGFGSLYSTTVMMDRCIDFALAMGTQWGRVFGCVKTLMLNNVGCSVVHSPEFSRWLALFPALKIVRWTDNYCHLGATHVFTREIRRKRIGINTVAGGPFPQVRVELVGDTLIPMPADSGFLSFPDDILLTIFEYLPSTELFDLSLVSRRLNFLALPVYLDRERILSRSTGNYTLMLSDRPKARDSLAALTIMLFLPRPTSLSCYIWRPPHVIFPSIDHLRRLISFVLRLPSVDEVSLHFGVPSVSHTSCFEEYDPLQYRWCSLFEELLNIIIAKSCTSLSVQGSPYLFPAAELWKERNLEGHQKTARLSPPAHTDIKMLSFEPASLLSPVFMPWTIPVIQRSQLTSIEIFISVEDQHYLEILADTIPHLRVLQIRGQSAGSKLLPSSLIFRLLARLSVLETLRIFDLYLSPSALPLAAPHLPRLKSLTGTDPYVHELLSATNPLPSLRYLEIHVFLPSEFTLEQNRGPPPNLPSIFMNLHRYNLAPIVTLTVIFFSFQVDATWPVKVFDKILGADWSEWCSRITTLKLEVEWPMGSKWSGWQDVGMYLPLLRERLDRFSALSNISFNDGLQTFESSVAKFSTAALIAQTIQRALPHVQTIHVNGKACKGG
ncbi:hypothetical protein C8R44DRAFT_976158 [Mycena epipterygia]|nr:hypothetical protein C8R44DRAFT_976158 [Mycena epipterygia]